MVVSFQSEQVGFSLQRDEAPPQVESLVLRREGSEFLFERLPARLESRAVGFLPIGRSRSERQDRNLVLDRLDALTYLRPGNRDLLAPDPQAHLQLRQLISHPDVGRAVVSNPRGLFLPAADHG